MVSGLSEISRSSVMAEESGCTLSIIAGEEGNPASITSASYPHHATDW